MPPEGPNKSEELLKRYAKERQEQAPNLPLHPATRRLLQGEVARQFGKKSENRGWSAWLGIMRGRLAIGAALGAVVVTGVCVWWNNQKPQPMEMAKAERTAKESALPFPSSADEMGLKAERQIAVLDTPSRIKLEDEVLRRAPAAPAEPTIKPNWKANPVGNASLATGAGQNTFAVQTAPVLASTSTSSSGTLLGRGVDFSGGYGLDLAVLPTEPAIAATNATLAKLDLNGGSFGSAASRSYYFEASADGKSTTNRENVALAYNLPVDGLSPVLPSAPLPSVTASLGDSKDFSKLSETDKLAGEPALLARRESEARDRSRRASLEPQAPATQPPATTAQPLRALGERAAADKRQQPLVPSQLRGDLVAQASTSPARPESNESNETKTRFFRQSATADTAASKQKTLRELDRLDAEPAVLNRFVIEQQGNSVRVVDADGSVYDGKVEEPVVSAFDSDLYETFAEKKDQLAREKPLALKGAPAPQIEGYSFRASGSNLTLHQMVVVNGRFAPTTDNVRLGAAGGAGAASSSPASAPAPTFKAGTISNRANGGQQPGFGGRYGYTTNQPATIEGTVRIGVTNQQWFRAVRNPR